MAPIRLREPVASGTRHYADTRLGLGGPIVWDAVRQREINNCPLPAILAAVAKVCPSQIGEMLAESSGGFTSHFADEPSRTRFSGERVIEVSFHGLSSPIRISPLLYYRDAKFRRLRFASADTSQGNNVWVSYVEKAYVAWPNRGDRDYATLDFDHPDAPEVRRFMFDLAGRFDLIQKEAGKKPGYFLDHGEDLRARSGKTYSAAALRKFLKKAGRLPTIATTWSDPDTLIGSHTYVVERFSRGRAEVWEPLRDSRESIALRDFWDEFDQVLQARGTSCS